MYIKKFVLLIIICLISFISTQVCAEIILKKKFFTGWNYSTDGINFKKVGSSGTDLREIMMGNEDALTHMSKYKKAKTWSTVTGMIGGACIGWPLGRSSRGVEWDNSFTAMIAIGIPLSIVSLVFDESADRNINKAVALYHGSNNESLTFMLDVRQLSHEKTLRPLFGLRYNF